jgi:hypothetical protein
MAALYITEYIDFDGRRQIPKEPALASSTVAIGATSTTSVVFGPQTRVVRIATDTACGVVIGWAGTAASPLTATLAASRMAAGGFEFRGVAPGQQAAVTALA